MCVTLCDRKPVSVLATTPTSLADESGSSEEDSDEQNTDEEMEEDVKENDWSEDINRREDVEFQEEVGINVDSENLRSCLDFFFSSLKRYVSC